MLSFGGNRTLSSIAKISDLRYSATFNRSEAGDGSALVSSDGLCIRLQTNSSLAAASTARAHFSMRVPAGTALLKTIGNGCVCKDDEMSGHHQNDLPILP